MKDSKKNIWNLTQNENKAFSFRSFSILPKFFFPLFLLCFFASCGFSSENQTSSLALPTFLEEGNTETIPEMMTNSEEKNAEKKMESSKISLLFTGDIMMDRYMRRTIDRKGIDFVVSAEIQNWLNSFDLTIGNHEGSVTPFVPKKAEPNMTTFTFAPETSAMLKKMGFDILNLGNNHTLDFGKNGFAESERILTENGFSIFGHPFNLPEKNFVMVEMHGKKLGFLGYHELFQDNLEEIVEQVKFHKPQVDFLFVLPHWGTEYLTTLPKKQQEKAHKIIDAGANAIIGTHPHVVQPFEVYNGKYIFYSLGNFIFDQVFSVEVQNGISVGMTIENDKISVEIFPTRMNKNFQMQKLDNEEADVQKKKLLEKSIL